MSRLRDLGSSELPNLKAVIPDGRAHVEAALRQLSTDRLAQATRPEAQAVQKGGLVFLPLNLLAAYMTASMAGTGLSNNGRPTAFSLSGAAGFPIEGGFYELTYDPLTSTPGGRLAVMLEGGNVLHLAPGSQVQLYGLKATILPDAACIPGGVAMLVLGRTPEAHFPLPARRGAHGDFGHALCGPNGALVQAQASTVNTPQVASDGVDLGGSEVELVQPPGGVTGYRVKLYSNAAGGGAGDAIINGNIVIWVADLVTGNFAETLTGWAIPASGRTSYQFPDVRLEVPCGRLYAEARDVNTGTPTDTLTVQIETWSRK